MNLPFEIAVQEESQREMSKPVLLLLKVIARKEINVFRCLILFPKLKIRFFSVGFGLRVTSLT